MKTTTLSGARKTVRSVLDSLADAYPDHLHLIDPTSHRALNYRQSRDHVAAIAQSIAAQGLQPGDAVAYAFSNSVDSALAILGILYGGHLATAINLVAGANTIEYVLEHSEARMIIADPATKRLLESCIAAPECTACVVGLSDLLSAQDSHASLPPPDAECDGLLMYTSGTTGRPKGVVHTQASLLCGGENTAMAHKLGQSDRGLCVLPFYHINAFCVSLMGSLVSGGALVIPQKFSVSSFWDTVHDTKCTWFSVVPTQISYLLHDSDHPDGGLRDIRTLRFGRSASAPLSPDVHAEFENRFGIPIIETMGLTETAAQILANPLPPAARKVGSPGVAFGNDVIIGDMNQQELPRGEEGEILVRGPNIMRGYLKNEHATAEALTASGWLRTGDLGRMDDDGYVYVTGRLKELIIKGGENIAPREIDEALYSHPHVIEAAAFGVSCKDYGQRIEAGVKLSVNSKVSADDLIGLCRNKLGAFKTPDRIHILADLPKGPSGKIQRNKLSETLSE